MDLKQSIDDEFGPAIAEKVDEFTEENAAMEAFIEERVLPSCWAAAGRS